MGQLNSRPCPLVNVLPTKRVMKGKKAMKNPNFSTLMSCEDVRALFDKLLFEEKELDVELRGRVKGHLYRCEPCSLIFADVFSDAVEEGRISVEPAPPMPMPPESILVAMGLLGRGGETKWIPLRQESTRWAKEMLTTAGRRLTATLNHFMQPRLGLGLALGPGMGPENEDPNAAAGWSDSEHISLVDDMGSPEGRTVLFEIPTPPTVTEDGVLRLQARTREAALEGTTLLCTVAVTEGARITFEGRLQAAAQGGGFEVEIKEEGIPFPQSSESPAAEPRTIVIPKRHVTLTLQKSN